MNFVIDNRDGANEMVVTGEWSSRAASVLESGQIDRLVLNYALGFDSPTLDFLSGQPVRELVVLDPRLTNIDPIHRLGMTLEVLSLTTDRSLDVDLNQLPNLRRLSADWSQVSTTIGDAVHLEDLALRAFAPRSLEPLVSLRRLASLTLKDRPRIETLAGASALEALKVLGVYLAKDLASIEDVAGCEGLVELAIESCRKIDSLEGMTDCKLLKVLNASECGDVASLTPIANLVDLEDIRLFGTTKILDGSLVPLMGLPKLQTLRMQGRRNYRPSVEEVQADLPRRWARQ